MLFSLMLECSKWFTKGALLIKPCMQICDKEGYLAHKHFANYHFCELTSMCTASQYKENTVSSQNNWKKGAQIPACCISSDDISNGGGGTMADLDVFISRMTSNSTPTHISELTHTYAVYIFLVTARKKMTYIEMYMIQSLVHLPTWEKLCCALILSMRRLRCSLTSTQVKQ